jgi:hypothetical protein
MPTNTLLPAPPRPGVADHLIVARDHADLCRVLREIFAGGKCSVVVDRRKVERRQHYQPVRVERRRGTRRGGSAIVTPSSRRPYELVRGRYR